MLKKYKFLIILALSLSMILLGKEGRCVEYMDGKLNINGFYQTQLRLHIAQRNPNNTDFDIFGENDNHDINMLRTHFQWEINYAASPTLNLYTKIKYVNESAAGVDNDLYKYDAFPVSYPGDLKIEDNNNMLQIQELYADIFAGNWWIRLGKQQVSWGQTDLFTLLDIVNPNDLSWRLISDAIFDGHDNVRESMWMARVNYSIPFIDFVDNPMLELLFIPNFVRKYIPDQPGNPYNIVPAVFKYHHEQPDGSEWGAKFSGLWKRFEFSLNYLRAYSDNAITAADKRPMFVYFDRRWGIPSQAIGFDVPPSGLGREDLIRFGSLGRHPLEHHIGFSFSYDDTELAGGVWRVEFLYEPNRAYEKSVIVPGFGYIPTWVERIGTIKYMVGLDRPTFIKAINKRRTVGFSFQLFQTLVVEDHDQLDDDMITLNGGPVQSLTTFMTLIIDTKYKADRINPLLAFGWDPRGGYIWGPQCEFQYGDNWRFHFAATFFGGGDRNGANDSFGALWWWDELMFRATYQF
jgi:hypothetical protein